jgi:hypothetical protein
MSVGGQGSSDQAESRLLEEERLMDMGRAPLNR